MLLILTVTKVLTALGGETSEAVLTRKYIVNTFLLNSFKVNRMKKKFSIKNIVSSLLILGLTLGFSSCEDVND